MDKHDLHIGTCSWKYDSWQGLVYKDKKPANYLQQYSQHFNTVEIDQWFWSLFAGDKAVLPKPSVVEEYARSVPEKFTFCIKIPNSITLTHHYKKDKSDSLIVNPHFLSVELMMRFLDSIEPLHHHLGPLMFQFEYLNKQKMSGLCSFIDHFGTFVDQLPKGFVFGVETRNPNYLKKAYFDFLKSQNLIHVFLHGYYMPSVFDIYKEHGKHIEKASVIRLHGPDRQEIEKQTGNDWSQIVAPKDKDIENLAEMVKDLQTRNIQPFILVNNHFEGSAPRTISRIMDAVERS